MFALAEIVFCRLDALFVGITKRALMLQILKIQCFVRKLGNTDKTDNTKIMNLLDLTTK